MCSFSVQIPDRVLSEIHMNQEEVQRFANQAIAYALYHEKNVPIDICAKLAGMSEEAFVDHRIHGAMSAEENVDETSATMAMEGMPLTADEKEMLYALQTGKISGDELRQRVITSIRTKAAG